MQPYGQPEPPCNPLRLLALAAPISWPANNFLLEVKDGSLCKSRRRLTPDEQRWHDTWAGTVHIVESAEQAVAIVSEAPPLNDKEQGL